MNTYGYVGGNPLSYVDPLGLYGLSDFTSDAGNVAAGFGDTITSGLGIFDTSLTELAREAIDDRFNFNSNATVNQCSLAYTAGKYGAYAWSVGVTWSGGLYGGANSVFWAGRGAHAAARTLGTTIDKTIIGGLLNGLKVENRLIWSAASATFALNAKNGTKAVIRYVSPKSIWKTERAILKARKINPQNY